MFTEKDEICSLTTIMEISPTNISLQSEVDNAHLTTVPTKQLTTHYCTKSTIDNSPTHKFIRIQIHYTYKLTTIQTHSTYQVAYVQSHPNTISHM